MLLGDNEAAIAAADSAASLSLQSGHHHTKLAAAINKSHVLERMGHLEPARKCVEYALGATGSNKHLIRAALDSLANLEITAGRYSECRILFEETARRARADAGARPHWDAISELASRSRLAIAERNLKGAIDDLSDAIKLANDFGDNLSEIRLRIRRARALGLDGQSEAATKDVIKASIGAADATTVAEANNAVAAIRATQENILGAQEALGRSIRVARAVSNAALITDMVRTTPLNQFASTTELSHEGVLPSPNLDSAVTLLDFAGHPHVLGREALAVLEGADCAEMVALVATGGKSTRVIEQRGWNDRDAVRAADTCPEGIEVLPVGRYRDETWQIVARPKTAIDPYCTFAAIRKLLATAVALDQYRRDEKQRAALWPADALEGDPDSIWASEQMAETVAIARRIAPTPLSVLLTGETGTGKEMLARAIHRASDRADKPFLPFNCTAVPRDMLESQLFGYRKGAFTGADTAFGGVIRAAAGGTLFLDEIADVNLEVQPKLLRFLETREIHPLGEPHPILVDVRIVAATNATSRSSSPRDASARTCSTASMPSASSCRRCANGAKKSRRSSTTTCGATATNSARDASPSATRRSSTCCSSPGRATSGSWPTRCGASWRWWSPIPTITPAMLSPDIQASRRTIPAPTAAQAELRLPLDQPLPAAVQLLEQMMVRRALDRSHGRVEEASRILGISQEGPVPQTAAAGHS